MEIVSDIIREDPIPLDLDAGWLNRQLMNVPAAEKLVEISTVFNPGGIRTPGGKTILILRFETRRGNSGLVCIDSEDGENWNLIPDSLHFSLINEGLEDPRVVWFNELSRYIITYVAAKRNSKIAFITTDEFKKNFERKGEANFLDESDIKIKDRDNKDACILPVSVFVNGRKRFGLIHRPAIGGEKDMWFSYSSEEITKQDLTNWEGHRCIAHTRQGTFWDNSHIGLGPQPVELPKEFSRDMPEGFLLLYHGARIAGGGIIYRTSLMWFSLEHLTITHRSPYWILGPRGGYLGKVVFPGAAFYDPRIGEVVVYYGKDDDGFGRCFLSPQKGIAHLKSYPV